MIWQILALSCGFLLLVLLLKRLFWSAKKPPRYPYQRTNLLYSADERAFFRTLKEAAGEKFEIFGKIQVGEIIFPKKGLSESAVINVSNPLESLQFHFVLCEKDTLAIACAVELYDKTQLARQGKFDLVPICEDVGLPFVRFSTDANYSVGEIRDKLLKAMVKEPLSLVETDGRKEPRISSLDDMIF